MGGSGQQFDWQVLENYDGDVPFILSGGIGPEDVERVRNFHHPKCIGIDLNSKFELKPGLKDVEKLNTFLANIETKKFKKSIMNKINALFANNKDRSF